MLICVAIVAVLATAVYGSLVTFWPWNTALTLKHYQFAETSAYGWSPYFNSLTLASLTALCGTVIIFSALTVLKRASVRAAASCDADAEYGTDGGSRLSAGFGLHLLFQSRV